MTIVDYWSDSSLIDLTEDQIDEFKNIVVSDLKNRDITPEQKDILNNNLDLWLYCLRVLRRTTEHQLSFCNSKIRQYLNEMKIKNKEYTDEHLHEQILNQDKRKISISKFLLSIERKTLYVKLLVSEAE